MVRVIVDNRVRIDAEGELDEETIKELRDEFTHENPKRESLKRGNVRGWWNEPAVIATWGEERGMLTFPRGGMSRVREILKKRGIEFKVYDRRVKFDRDARIPDSIRELREYQIRIVDGCLAIENCLVTSGTGSGKTTALLGLYGRMKVPTLVLVHQLNLIEQWMERAVEELEMKPRDIGIVGAGKMKLTSLTLGTPKSVAAAIKKDPRFVELWGAVLVDEVHLFAARSLFACVDQFPARYRVGASDDEKRKDRQEFLLYDLFGAKAAEVSDKELVEKGAIMDVEVLIVPTAFEADWYVTGEDEDKKPDFGLLVREMSEDFERQQLLDAIIATELREGRQIIIFAKERDHCRSLGAMAAGRAPSGYLIGGPDYRDEFKRTKKGMKDGSIRVGVGTYQACGIALDIPYVEVGICAAPVLANKTSFRQARGRVCRKPVGKSVARLYVLWDREVFGLRHLENAARWNPSTFVWDGARWVPVRECLKKERMALKEAKDG